MGQKETITNKQFKKPQRMLGEILNKYNMKIKEQNGNLITKEKIIMEKRTK